MKCVCVEPEPVFETFRILQSGGSWIDLNVEGAVRWRDGAGEQPGLESALPLGGYVTLSMVFSAETPFSGL